MKIILNILTHGDEKIGLRVLDEIKKLNIDKRNLIFQIANKKAVKLGKRFIDQDLNRSFPGKKDGNYEEKLAYKLSPIIKSADIVIDIHSTTSHLKDALILTKINKETREFIQVIQPKYVLVMKATKNNALISQAKIGIAFEYGKDNSEIALRKTVLGIKRILKKAKLLKKDFSDKKTLIPPNFFEVKSVVVKPEGYILFKGIKNYQLIKKGQTYASLGRKKLIAKKNFYPILFGEKKYKDYFGFAGQKI
jgi:succinylglutamate desuccinylase